MRNDWKGKLCAIACLSSISGKDPYVVFKGVYDSGAGWDANAGWKHQNCVDFLRRSRFEAAISHFRIFRGLFRYVARSYEYYLASMKTPSGSHMLIVCWIRPKTLVVYGYDPGETGTGRDFEMSYADFLSNWRGCGIAVFGTSNKNEN